MSWFGSVQRAGGARGQLRAILLVLCLAQLLLLGCDRGSESETSESHEGHEHEQEGAAGEGEGHEGHGHSDESAGESHEGHDHADEAAGESHEGHDHGEEEEGEHADEEGVVHLSQSALSRAGIEVAPVTKVALDARISVPAEVQANPDRIAHVSPMVDGKLIEVGAAVGDRVESGQELARMRSIALGEARAELERVNAVVEVTRKAYERQKQLHAEGITAKKNVLAAEADYKAARAEQSAARSRLEVLGVEGGSGPELTLESPIAGLVTERHATRGENVTPDDTLFVVADLARVWVLGRVYEKDLAAVHTGMPATLTLAAYPQRVWQGQVDWVGSALDEKTRTLPVRVELDNADQTLRPGLFGTLQLAAASNGVRVPVVPEAAVQDLEQRKVVFVPAGEPGEFRAVPVVLGRSVSGLVEIVAGLEPDARVVVRGAFTLKSELVRSELGHGHAH